MSDNTTSPKATSRSTAGAKRTWQRWVPIAVALGMAIMVILPARQALRAATPVRVQPALPIVETGVDTLVSTAPNVRTVQAAGWIEPAPFATGVSALTDGVAQTVHALEGDTVEAGDVLVELDPTDARIATQELNANAARSKARVTQAEAELAAAQADWDEAIERERAVAVAKAALAEAQADRDRLPAQLREADATVNRWQVEVDRLRQARRNNAVTEVELRIAEADLAASEARRDALVEQRPERDARVDRRAAELRAAERGADLRIEERRALDTAKAALDIARAEAATAQAMLDAAELRLERMTIRAPITGNVLVRMVEPGQRVMLNMDAKDAGQVYKLYDPANLQVRTDVPLADAGQVFVGQRAEVIVDVLPDETFAGEVTAITHQADLQKNTLEVKVRIDAPAALLRPDMLARVKFIGSGGAASADASEPVARVPQGSVVAGNVWVVRDRRGTTGTAMPVQPADVRVGDLVVLNPTNLESGQQVRMEGGAS